LEISFHNANIFVVAVYASTSYLTRRELWTDLTYVIDSHPGPWLSLGDFNAILGAHEKRGRRPPPILSCIDFLHWTSKLQISIGCGSFFMFFCLFMRVLA